MLQTTNNFQVETTFSIASEEELLRAFRPKDQKKLIIPNSFPFPLNVRSYLTWKEPSGVYTYLVYKNPNWDLPRGVVFKRMSIGADHNTGGMCNWCHSYGSSEEIAMLSVAVNSNTSYSYILCQDLRCIEKIEEAAALSGKSAEKSIDQLYYRMKQLFEGISHQPLD